MGKTSAVDRLIAELELEKADLERRVELKAELITRLRGPLMRREKPKQASVRTKQPKPGELRDRAILGVEPSL